MAVPQAGNSPGVVQFRFCRIKAVLQVGREIVMVMENICMEDPLTEQLVDHPRIRTE